MAMPGGWRHLRGPPLAHKEISRQAALREIIFVEASRLKRQDIRRPRNWSNRWKGAK